MGKPLICKIQNGHQMSTICCISALKWPIRVINNSGKVFWTQEGIWDGTKFNKTNGKLAYFQDGRHVCASAAYSLPDNLFE